MIEGVTQKETFALAVDLSDLLSMLEEEIVALRADVDRLSKLIAKGF